MFTLLLSAAFADAPDKAAVQALASKALGKDVPGKYLCMDAPKLPEAIAEGTTVVGIKVKNKGCTLKGIIVDGTWVEPGVALVAAVPTWASLDADAREAIAIPWVRDILLAFEQPMGAPAWDGTTVTTELVHRIPHPQHAEQGQATFTFAKDGSVKRSLGNTQAYKTGMAVKINATKGITAADATKGLSSTGKLIKECVRAAWARDLTSAGRTRLAWDIVEKKATNVTARGWGSTPLRQCYSNAIGKIEFAADGHVDLTIAITRNAVAAP